MNIPGYDAWKLASPPEADDPQCDYCGGWKDVRVESDVFKPFQTKPTLVCEECFTSTDTGPCFDDLQTAEEYYGEQEADKADYLYQQQRDREMDDAQ